MSKRARGRPKGTDLPSDRPILPAIADLILDEPELRPTTAIKRIIGECHDSVIRRILRKWAANRDSLIAEALNRKSCGRDEGSPQQKRSGGSNSSLLVEQARRLIDDPVFRMAHGQALLASAAFAKRVRVDDPLLRAAQGQALLASAAFTQAARGINGIPSLRLLDEINNSPAMRMMQEFRKTPTARLIEAHKMAMRSLGL